MSKIQLPTFADVLREVWVTSYTRERCGATVEVVDDSPDLPPFLYVTDADWDYAGKHAYHALDFTDWLYGPAQLLRSLDRQIHDILMRFAA